jgi:glycosyltransferase involved in cell wall biosynthesis
MPLTPVEPFLSPEVCPPTPQPPLTVLIPVYNEERTIDELLRRVAAGPYPDKEVIVIDDGSSDATPRLLEPWADRPGFRILRHAKNQGKGAAVRTGLAHARGEVTIIQDADLEYDPADYTRLVEPIRHGDAQVVYGSRYLAPTRRLPWTKFRVGVMLFNGMVRVLYGQRTTDEATCYKAVRTRLFRALDLQAVRFELCPEMTAKLCRLGVRIAEVPVSYQPRGVADGKKIGWRDGASTVWTLLRWRVTPFTAASDLE